ncbi:MAG: hypothetical protein GF329_12830 [Candidatus Lokiarchaeota archaeon]|nr:hypothetical protein [Candidatus Lokiarchaeota archaeon]
MQNGKIRIFLLILWGVFWGFGLLYLTVFLLDTLYFPSKSLFSFILPLLCILTGLFFWNWVLSKKINKKITSFLFLISGILSVGTYFLQGYNQFNIFWHSILGFMLAFPLSFNNFQFTRVTTISNRGFSAGFLAFFMGLTILILTFLNLSGIASYPIFFILIGILTLITSFLYYIIDWDALFVKEESFTRRSEKGSMKKNLSYIMVLFTIGILIGYGLIFEIENPEWATFLFNLGEIIFGSTIQDYLITHSGGMIGLFFVAISFCITSIIWGKLADIKGRKSIMISAFVFSILGIVVFELFRHIITFTFAAISWGCMTTIFIILLNTLLGDLKIPFFKRSFNIYSGAYFGMGTGVIISLFLLTQSLTTIFLTCSTIIIIGFIAILRSEETLPDTSELDWFSAIQHLYIIYHNGICMYNYPFRPSKSDDQLFAGGITGISTMIQELTENKSRLKAIRQERGIVLLEYGEFITYVLICSKELTVLHNKLQELQNEFEDFYEDIIPSWNGNDSVFIPTRKIIEKIFIPE